VFRIPRRPSQDDAVRDVIESVVLWLSHARHEGRISAGTPVNSFRRLWATASESRSRCRRIAIWVTRSGVPRRACASANGIWTTWASIAWTPVRKIPVTRSMALCISPPAAAAPGPADGAACARVGGQCRPAPGSAVDTACARVGGRCRLRARVDRQTAWVMRTTLDPTFTPSFQASSAPMTTWI
jgi:hypothetical protein